MLASAAVMISRPHDALFKSAFEAPAAAAALLRELLPPAIRDAIAWHTLDRETGSFIDAALADLHSDLLFSARLHTREPSPIYLLLEHQSTADPAMPLRMAAYQIRIWDRVRKDDPRAWLPLVVAVVVSHVPGGWGTSRSFEHMFDPSVLAIPGLVALVPRFSLIVEDLAHRTNDELKAWSLAPFQKLALWLLRDARDPARLLDNFQVWVEELAEVARAPAGSAGFTTLVTYLFRVVDPMHRDELRAKIRQLDPRAEEAAMTIAEQLHEEGRAEGRVTALRDLLVLKFGAQALAGRYESVLQTATREAIDRYLQRVLAAGSIAAVFED